MKKSGLLDEEQEQGYWAAAAVGFCQKECVLLLGKDDGVRLSEVSLEWRGRQQGRLQKSKSLPYAARMLGTDVSQT